MRGFLCHRTQTDVVDGDESSEVPVTSGVPQGSVLGLILFLVYINNPPYHVTSEERLFADDTALCLSLNKQTDSNTLQKNLDSLQVWEYLWDMEFNPSKCQVIQITRARKPPQTNYKFHGQTLEITPHAKYLGITFTNKLDWTSHIDNITNKANNSLGFIRRIIKTKHQKTRQLAYNTSARHHPLYLSRISNTKGYYKFSLFPRTIVLWIVLSLSRTLALLNLPLLRSLSYTLKYQISF